MLVGEVRLMFERVNIASPTSVCLGQGRPMYSQIGNQSIAKHKVIFDNTFLRYIFILIAMCSFSWVLGKRITST